MSLLEVAMIALEPVIAERRFRPRDVEMIRVRKVGDVAAAAYVVRRRDGTMVFGFAGARRLECDHGESAEHWHPADGWISGGRENAPTKLWTWSGGWGSDAYETSTSGVLGGWVRDPETALVRLTDPTGRVVEDEVERGVAILAWTDDLVIDGALVELIDESGTVLLSDTVTRP